MLHLAAIVIAAVLGPVVPMQATSDDDDPGVRPAIGGLEPGTVLRLSIEGFPAFAKASASQCSLGLCSNSIDVQLDDDGTARVQYLVFDDFAASAGGCRLDTAPCSIVIENVDGDERAEIDTLFTDELPPPGRLRVSRDDDLVAGDHIDVLAEGFLPGAEMTALVCVVDSNDCIAAGEDATFTVDDDGTARGGATVHSCPRSSECELRVRGKRSLTRAAAVPLAFATPPGAEYDAGRVALGLAIAFVLCALTLYLIRRTDWRPVGEEDAPEIDDAEYADLDAMVALLPPEDDELHAFD